MATRISSSVDGSGTDDGLPPTTELLGDRDDSSMPAPLLMLAEVMPSAPKGPLGVSELGTAPPASSCMGIVIGHQVKVEPLS